VPKNKLRESRPDAPAAPAPYSIPKAEGIDWVGGFDGVLLCWIGSALVFPYSAFFGLTAMGIGSLMVGAAFGRD
jgi:hypothetical protein